MRRRSPDNRALLPHLQEFLYELSWADGADQTVPDIERWRRDNAADAPIKEPDPAHNYEPYGEIGLVLQRDADWNEQTGAPQDLQPGAGLSGRGNFFLAGDCKRRLKRARVNPWHPWHAGPDAIGALTAIRCVLEFPLSDETLDRVAWLRFPIKMQASIWMPIARQCSGCRG